MDEWRRNLLNEIATVEQEIETVAANLKELRSRRDRLKKVLYDGRTDELRGQDSLLVLASDIAPHVKQWIELYDAQHGKGGQLLLAERSTVSTRRIRAIVNRTSFGGREGRFITLQTADRLLTAMGMGYLVADLDIVPTGSVRQANVPEPPFQHYEEE